MVALASVSLTKRGYHRLRRAECNLAGSLAPWRLTPVSCSNDVTTVVPPCAGAPLDNGAREVDQRPSILMMKDGEARRYEHAPSGALILLPAYPEEDKILEYHLLMVRTTLENFGIADPTTFDKKL